jgi:hypothetical protein
MKTEEVIGEPVRVVLVEEACSEIESEDGGLPCNCLNPDSIDEEEDDEEAREEVDENLPPPPRRLVV